MEQGAEDSPSRLVFSAGVHELWMMCQKRNHLGAQPIPFSPFPPTIHTTCASSCASEKLCQPAQLPPCIGQCYLCCYCTSLSLFFVFSGQGGEGLFCILALQVLTFLAAEKFPSRSFWPESFHSLVQQNIFTATSSAMAPHNPGSA